jgi:hypothetical protein
MEIGIDALLGSQTFFGCKLHVILPFGKNVRKEPADELVSIAGELAAAMTTFNRFLSCLAAVIFHK